MAKYYMELIMSLFYLSINALAIIVNLDYKFIYTLVHFIHIYFVIVIIHSS